ncbi:MAG: hypothetical protein K2J30_03330, partial [Clostridia bacterium]|nr:hypothetical protein [Clostridia bacterium]
TITVSAFNSENDGLIESDVASLKFNVNHLQTYTAQDIAGSECIMGNSEAKIEVENGAAKINSDHVKDYGAYAPEGGVQVNLANRPFVHVEIAGVEAKEGNKPGYLIRGKMNDAVHVLANDTEVAADYKGDLYVDLWRNVDGNPITGEGKYQFGMGFVWGTSIFVKSISYVEITTIEELDPEAHTPLAAPANIREDKGVIKADIVDGNKAYTPKYSAKVTEKGGAELYNQTNLSEPSVNIAALNLESGKTYTVTFKAIGDNGYFVDSPETSVDVQYTAVTLIDNFTDVDFTTYESRNDGSGEQAVKDGPWIPQIPETTVNEQGALVSTTKKNGYWGFKFMALDLSDIMDDIDREFYMQLVVDGAQSTPGATIATRFTVRADDGTVAPVVVGTNDKGEPTKNTNIRDTGYGETPAGDTHLTKEWRDVISNDNTFGFAVGHGGITVEGDVAHKTIVYTGIQFVKFTIVTNAD